MHNEHKDSESRPALESRTQLTPRAFVRFLMLGAVCLWATISASFANVLLSNAFNYPNGVITTEYQSSPRNPDIEMNSGSVYGDNGAAWTGFLTSENNSAVFRLITRRSDFTNLALTVAFYNVEFSSSDQHPALNTDGFHIWPRFLTEEKLYVVSVNRRDNRAVIKKKTPGGTSNGGTYFPLTREVPFPVHFHGWQLARVVIQDDPSGAVLIDLYVDDKPILSAKDDGSTGGPAIKGPSRVGVRGDNLEFKFDNLTVMDLPARPPPEPISNLSIAATAGDSVTIQWPAFNDAAHFLKAEVFVEGRAAKCFNAPISLLSSSGSITKARITGLSPGNDYAICVYHATDPTHWSVASNVVRGRTN